MKTTDFRVGNYYIPTDGSESPRRAEPRDIFVWGEGAIYGNPIPLTDEMLVELGFTKPLDFMKEIAGIGSDYWELEVRVTRTRKITFCTKRSERLLFIEDTLGGSIGIAKPEYVHQIQNLIYALTGIEVPLKPKKQ